MKFLVILSCIALAAAERSYNIYGGYKEQGKYVYHYEAFLNPAKVPNLEKHIAKLHFNGTVELHILKNDKAALKIKEFNIYECLSDPKNMSGVNERVSEFSNKVSRPFLMKPLKFAYSNGLVQQVFASRDDPDWSVNIKKSILNMLHVDVTGKDTETGLKDFFTKEEATILGICMTAYSHKHFEVVDARQMRRRVGMNFTKTIDFEKCTGLEHDVYNKIIQGRNQDQDSNPLKTTATIKYNITGTENKFKIEGVTAKGVYVLFPFSKQEEGIPTESVQRLTLLKESASRIEEEHFHEFDHFNQRGKLMMQLPSFHKPEIVPPMEPRDRENKAIYVCNAIKKFSSLIPSGAPVQSIILVPEISTVFMQVVHNLRMCDSETLSRVWKKCTDESTRSWLVYALSLCHTETCMESMRLKIQTVKEDDILTYLQGISFAGQPTRRIVNKMQKLCSLPKIANNPKLIEACWISSSNIAKGFCKVNPICSSWVETSIVQALQKISRPECYQNIESCQPINSLSVHTVMSIAENLGRPSLLTPLEHIIFNTEIPTNVRMHSVSCCRPIIRQSPKRVQILLLRLFRDFKYDSQMRTLALSVLMENPHPHIVQLCARQIYVEPSLNIRKFAHELFTQCSESVIKYNRTIRHTCKSVLKLYSKLYLPSSMTNYRSLHMNGQVQSRRLNIASELEGNWIANNNSYLPRFSQARLRASILGRKFEVFDSEMYMQGIQDYINWFVQSMQEYFEEPSEAFVNVQKRIYDISQRTSHVPREPEDLIYEGRLKLLDKLVSVQHVTMNKTADVTDQLYEQLPQILQAFKQLKDGKTWMWTQPFMPIEVMYRVPSLVGIPLVYNMTSIVMPYARTQIKLETKPEMKTPMSLIRKKLEEVKASGIQQLSSLAEIRGTIKFCLPFIEVGAQCRKVMNASTHVEGSMKYNFKTGEYNEECKMPKDMREISYFTMEASHYIKTSKEPIRRLEIEPDQLNKVQIINVTKPCEGHCRSEEWVLRTTSGKYLSVQDRRIVLKPQPFKFKVIFHGVNRRIISLYVPDQGYVVMSRKSSCLFVRPTGSGKYFVVDFDNLHNTLIKTLVHLEKVPSDWGVPSYDEINELKRMGDLFMQEQVVISGEEYIEKELIEPWKQHVRLTYLALSEAPKVCLSPKKQSALNFTADRQTNFTTLLTRYSYSNRTCIGKPWGFNLCLHGYYPVSIARSPISLLCSPSKFRVTCRPDKDTKVTSIKTNMKFVKNTTTEWTYRSVTRLVGTPKTIVVNTNWQRQDYKLKIRVNPSDPMLLRMKKLCYDEHFQPDNYSWTMSVDDKECKRNHLKVDFLAPQKLPRHQMAFRINYTTEGLPSFWRQTLWYLDYFVMRPSLRYSSDYWYSNMTAYRNLTQFSPNATFNGTAYVQYLLTSKDTLTYKIIAPSEVWVWEDIKLNTFIKSLPKGSKQIPVTFKLYWSKGKACCHHKNSTFITFDKNVYNYTMKRGCDHVLLRSCYKNMTQLMVLTRRMGSEQSVRRIVTTLVDTYEIVFIPKQKYSQRPVVMINRKNVTLQNNRYEIWKYGRRCLVVVWEPETQVISLWHVQTQLWVALARGYKVHTSVGQMLFGKVCGMCGNFNGEQRFEFTTPEGKLIRDVQKPKLYDPELKFYEERHFGNSWFIPGRKCARGECNFKREFLKVEHGNKYCLTRLRVPQCQQKCTTTAQEQLKAPVVCVARNESSQLLGQLVSGKPLTLFTATDQLLAVSLPIKCNCPCKNRYKYFKGGEDDDYDEKYYAEYDKQDYYKDYDKDYYKEDKEEFKPSDYAYDFYGLQF